jgi:phosphoglycolate phosphatase
MKPIDSLIFDLDGTLWDTGPSCAIAWNEVIRANGISFREIIADDIRRVAGLPHSECIRIVFQGLPQPALEKLTHETMEADTRVIAQLGGRLYDGVAEGLAALRSRFPLYIASNCQSGYIETFLKWTGFAGLFSDFECWGNTGQTKASNVAQLMGRNGLQSPILIGDTEGDRTAAAACGIPFAHVTYGFGVCDQWDVSAKTFGELAETLMSLGARQ